MDCIYPQADVLRNGKFVRQVLSATTQDVRTSNLHVSLCRLSMSYWRRMDVRYQESMEYIPVHPAAIRVS